MPNKKRIVCDLDGVLVDFNNPMWTLLRREGAILRAFEQLDPRCWAWYVPYGATSEQVEQAWMHVSTTPDWWEHLPAHRDYTFEASALLARLHREHEVTFVSCRPCGRNASARWLELYVGKGCHVIHTPHDKVPALMAMQPDAVIEDNRTTLMHFHQMRSQAEHHLILVDRAYNQGGEDVGFTRVPTTLAALRHIAQEFA